MTELIWASPDDWKEWREIRLESLLDTPNAYGSTYEHEIAFQEADWRQRLAGPAVLIRDGGTPVAMGAAFMIFEDTMQIVAMYVRPSHRRRGLSRQVLDALVAWGRERGHHIQLHVNSNMAVARTAYLSYGFVATGEKDFLRTSSAEVCEQLVLPS